MPERLTLRQVEDEARQLAAVLRGTGNQSLRDGQRSEPLMETPYGRAVQCIHRGLHRKQEAMRGDFDDEIKTLFASYLASKYGESAEEIQRHAESKKRRVWSAFKVGTANVMGTLATGLTATFVPKTAVWAGLGVAGLLGTGGAAIPAVAAALAMAAPIGVTHLTRRATRDLRESQLAGKILSETFNDDAKKTRLRAAIAGGADIFKEFDTLIVGRGLEGAMRRHSNKLWTVGMLGVGGLLGTIGAGGLDKFVQTVSESSGSLIELLTKLFDAQGTFRGSSWLSAGAKEWTDFAKYFWEHVTAVVGLTPNPSPQPYYNRFFHMTS